MDCLIIFLVALAGGCLPLLWKWSHRFLHSALALSTGIFLGAVFLHMLPEVAGYAGEGHDHGSPVSHPEPADPDGDAHHHPHDHGMTIWLSVMIGVLVVYLLEGLVFRSHDHDDLHRHRAVGFASLAGLSAHALTAGFALAAASVGEHTASPMFLAIVAHKGFETFSLATVFQLAEFSRRWTVVTLVLFATITPIGILLGTSLVAHLPHGVLGVVFALATGTFLYVCLCELLPELFHHKEDSVAKILLLALGVVIMVVVEGGAHG